MMRNNLTRRGFTSLMGACALSALGLAGCSSSSEKSADAASVEFTTHEESRDLMGSADTCDVRVGLIMGPPSMGLSQFIVAAQNGLTKNNFTFTPNGVDYVGLSAAFNQGDYDICTLPSNIGPILYNNDELKNDYEVISINNLGVLYVMTNDESLATLDDLAGRTVYSYGQGGTPEYTIEALLKKKGIENTFNLEFKSSPLEVLNMMQEQENCVAILPQPFVSLAKILVNPLYIPIDLTVEWDEAFSDTGSQAVTTTTIVNKAFLEAHEQAVIEYLDMAGQSVTWSLANMGEAASLQEELGTFLNNSVALDAMPYISMTNLTGETMRTALSGFVEELYRANPDSVGGALPGEDFYYLPPKDALDKDYLQAGLEEATQHKSSAGTGNDGTTATKEEAEAAMEAFGGTASGN
jgi:NitT/TauT family transport system substrate-binding protein